MLIRIADIPPEGRNLSFDLDLSQINDRVLHGDSSDKAHVIGHEQFTVAPKVDLLLRVEGSTVMVKGRAKARYKTQCARCTEDVEMDLDVPVDIILKPANKKDKNRDLDEDLQLGFYDGKEVDCAPIASEPLVLSLPTRVLCRPDCKGLCPKCGNNRNSNPCNCSEEHPEDERFSIFRQLKLQ